MENLEENLIPETKKSKKKKIVLVGLICVAALAIVFATWVFLIQPKFFPTIYWKTYKSEKNGFQVKYPRDYQVKKSELTAFDWKYNPEMSAISKEGVSFKRNDKNVVLQISVKDNPMKLSVAEWLNWLVQKGVLSEEGKATIAGYAKNITINNIPVMRLDWNSDSQVSSQIYLAKNDKIFDIYYEETPLNNKNNKAVFDLFLKSLQID